MGKKMIVLIDDLVIPKGTVFDNCDNLKVEFASGNYTAIVGTGKNGIIDIYLNEDVVSDNPCKFELLEFPEDGNKNKKNKR